MVQRLFLTHENITEDPSISVWVEWPATSTSHQHQSTLRNSSMDQEAQAWGRRWPHWGHCFEIFRVVRGWTPATTKYIQILQTCLVFTTAARFWPYLSLFLPGKRITKSSTANIDLECLESPRATTKDYKQFQPSWSASWLPFGWRTTAWNLRGFGTPGHGGVVEKRTRGQKRWSLLAMTSAERFLEEALEKSDADLFKDLFRIYPLAEAGMGRVGRVGRCELYDFMRWYDLVW